MVAFCSNSFVILRTDRTSVGARGGQEDAQLHLRTSEAPLAKFLKDALFSMQNTISRCNADMI
jgi:hypothetical protein